MFLHSTIQKEGKMKNNWYSILPNRKKEKWKTIDSPVMFLTLPYRKKEKWKTIDTPFYHTERRKNEKQMIVQSCFYALPYR
jgi:hypothetical protein